MKRFAIACSALFILSFHATAQTYLNCDFEDGMPLTFTLIDNDGNTPSDDATKKGFAVGTPWIVARPQGEKSNVAMATSWYSPNGASDDWMITPAFTVNDDNVRLSWRARSSMKSTKYHEDYSVYVSTTGGTAVADFDKSKPLATVKGESYYWTTHSVDLSTYKGKTITVALRRREQQQGISLYRRHQRVGMEQPHHQERPRLAGVQHVADGAQGYGDEPVGQSRRRIHRDPRYRRKEGCKNL